MRVRTLAAAIALLPSVAFAWGGQGHQVVALIAQIHLTPEAKTEITKLLGPGLNIYDADVASWADQIKREQRATADWHYVNIPFDADGYDEARDGRTKTGKTRDNVVHAINDQVAILSDATAPKEKRAEALKWVVHLIGDSTQPLHCAVRDKDGGGNGCKVWMPGSNAKTPKTCTRCGTRRC